jgi:hypothetical protein
VLTTLRDWLTQRRLASNKSAPLNTPPTPQCTPSFLRQEQPTSSAKQDGRKSVTYLPDLTAFIQPDLIFLSFSPCLYICLSVYKQSRLALDRVLPSLSLAFHSPTIESIDILFFSTKTPVVKIHQSGVKVNYRRHTTRFSRVQIAASSCFVLQRLGFDRSLEELYKRFDIFILPRFRATPCMRCHPFTTSAASS